jgi:hypothetical protein
MSYLVATDGWLFPDPKDFSEQIAVIQKMGDEILKNPLPPEISIKDAYALIDANFKLNLELHKQCEQMRADHFFFDIPIRKGCQVIFDYFTTYVMALSARTLQAKRAGQATVSSEGFNQYLAGHLHQVAQTYEALALISFINSSLFLSFPVLAVTVKIGEVWQDVLEVAGAGLKAATDAANALGSAFSKLGDIIKWATIGGGLFMLYWYVLKPKKKKS